MSSSSTKWSEKRINQRVIEAIISNQKTPVTFLKMRDEIVMPFFVREKKAHLSTR